MSYGLIVLFVGIGFAFGFLYGFVRGVVKARHEFEIFSRMFRKTTLEFADATAQLAKAVSEKAKNERLSNERCKKQNE